MSASSILLLANPQSYRLAAFHRAAISVGTTVTVGIDSAPGFSSSDPAVLPLSFPDLAGALGHVRASFSESGPDAVIAVDDSAAELAQFISRSLGLQTNAPGSEVAGRDKAIMRDCFESAGLRSPGRVMLSPSSDPGIAGQKLGFPLVVKPTMLNGSRGVIRVDDPEELRSAFARTGRIVLAEGFAADFPGILIEEFIPGIEVAVEGVMTGGVLQVLALFDKPDPLDGPFFEETIYVTPSRLDQETQCAIRQTTEAMALAIGVLHGPIHAELRINDTGVWPIEVAARSIGGLCSSVLEFGAGMSLEELIVRHALGENVGPARTTQAAGVMMIPIPKSGMLRSVGGIDEALEVPGITGVEISALLNAPITALPEGASYLGFIFARAETPQLVEDALRRAHGRLVVEIGPLLPISVV